MKTVYAFDFDGTLTFKDTFIEFIRYVVGDAKFSLGFIIFSPMLILMKLHILPNYKVKQQIFSWFFKGVSIHTFNEWCIRFAREKSNLLRPQAITYLHDATTKGDVVVISASIENWVRPFFNKSNVKVVGTILETDENEMLTGRFSSANCYGKEKVNRLIQLFPDRANYQLIAFGDSAGDTELMQYADKALYKPFR